MDPLSFFLVLLIGFPLAAAIGWELGGLRRGHRPRVPLPGLWWLCDGCQSVNEPTRSVCYACGRPIPATPRTLSTEPDQPTEPHPPTSPTD